MLGDLTIQPRIRPFDDHDLAEVVALSLRAWAPVFASLERELGSEIFKRLYSDWRASQQQAVEAVCAEEAKHVWVAEVGARAAGFVAIELHPESSIGEIYMIAVDPDYQGSGIGTALSEFALEWIKEAGMAVAMVETGGDPGHAPARRTYEKTGFVQLPIARYFKAV